MTIHLINRWHHWLKGRGIGLLSLFLVLELMVSLRVGTWDGLAVLCTGLWGTVIILSLRMETVVELEGISFELWCFSFYSRALIISHCCCDSWTHLYFAVLSIGLSCIAASVSNLNLIVIDAYLNLIELSNLTVCYPLCPIHIVTIHDWLRFHFS